MELTADGQKDWAEAAEMIQLTMVGNLTQKFRDTFLGGKGTDFKPFRSLSR
ncbi:hypothetical protein ACW4TU_42375 [Streptomyces sp. QTS52]